MEFNPLEALCLISEIFILFLGLSFGARLERNWSHAGVSVRYPFDDSRLREHGLSVVIAVCGAIVPVAHRGAIASHRSTHLHLHRIERNGSKEESDGNTDTRHHHSARADAWLGRLLVRWSPRFRRFQLLSTSSVWRVSK